MKVVAVLGSPQKEGASSTIATEVLRGAKDAGHEVVVYYLNEMNVRGCQNCGYCKNNQAECIVEDDLKPYWKDLQECGALVLAAPNYCGQVCGPMITYMNRHYCLMMKDGTVRGVQPGVKLIGVFSQGYSDTDYYKEGYKEYLHDFEARKMSLQEILIHGGDAPYDADSEIMKKAYQAGCSL